LSEPLIKLHDDKNNVNFPFSSRTVDSFLYRKVSIIGRPLHNRAMLVPKRSYGLDGYEYIVPIVTNETKDGDPLEGVLLNKGFVPYEYAPVACRMRIENSFDF
jgi:cytochrome oxidase assembly protein ShyY1